MPADFTASTQDWAPVVISTMSAESVGPGMSAIAPGTAFSSKAWTSASAAIYIPFVVPVPLTVLQMGCYNGATANGNVDIGIYDDQQNRLVSMGLTAQSGTNAVQAFDITDTTIDPGLYYFGFVLTSGTATTFSVNSTNGPRAVGCMQQASAFPLPNPATFAVLTAAVVAELPLIMLTAKTVV